MTNTPLSEREKELVEAVRSYFPIGGYVQVKTAADRDKINRIVDALRAYKPEKEYTMPEWIDFYCKYSIRTGGPNVTVMKAENEFGERQIFKDDYNAIREATAKNKWKEG